MNKEFNEVVSEFFSRNKIDKNSDENYIKGFSGKFGKFLSQVPFSANEKVKELVLKCIRDDYRYYSEEEINIYLKKFHAKLINQIEEQGFLSEQCMFSDILNEATYKHNSSNELVTKYITLNNLKNSQYIHFNTMVEKYTELKEEEDEYLKRSKQIILEKEIETNKKRLEGIEYLIMIDDYTGTGSTIITFLESIIETIPSSIEIVIYCIHGTYVALESIEKFIENLGDEKPNITLKFEEISRKYFSNCSTEEEIIRKFSEKNLLDDEYTLGYKDTQSVLTTYRNTPNNTLSLFWKESTREYGWEPLFLRAGKKGSSLKKLYEEKKAILWYFEYHKIEIEHREVLYVLLYIKNYPQFSIGTINIELPKLLGYNKDILQCCLSNNFIAIKPNDSFYILTEDGKKILREKFGRSITIKAIVREYTNLGMKKEKRPLKL